MKCTNCGGRGAVQIAPNVKGLKRCPVCGGSGEVSQIEQTNLSCPICNYPDLRECGNGIYQCDFCETYFDKDGNIVLTEQEWLQTATTEQLAEFLIVSIKNCKSCASGIGFDEVEHCPFGECGCHFKEEVIKWLKQPHITKV